ncbi:MAG: DUF5683 domain-containing protein [Candidatus Latescibacterota bacterium]
MPWTRKSREQVKGVRGQGSGVRSQESGVRSGEGPSGGSGSGQSGVFLGLLVASFLFFANEGALWASQEVSADTAHTDASAAKSPRGALLRSLALPGWGQWYNERPVKGAVIFSTELFLGGAILYENRRSLDFQRRNTYFLWFLGVLLYNLADAYVDAHLYDFEGGAEQVGLTGSSSADGAPMISTRIWF